jgi:hypothetical protein
LSQQIWRDHVWRRQTVADLKKKYTCGEKTIRRTLDQVKLKKRKEIKPQSIVAVFDATHLGEQTLLVARAPAIKTNIGAAWIQTETKEAYAGLRQNIEGKGFKFLAVVLDGRTGIPRVFQDIPVQICQFHQLQIVKRKLTLRPETEAGQTLLTIAFTLAHTSEDVLRKQLDDWILKYEDFITEKTYVTGTKHWRYTHRRVRSAYQSLRKNLPYLFTYQKYSDLNIPNTTNSLDGFWSRLKNLLSAHRGKSKDRMKKMVEEILRN